jgi:hypothetical protein
VDPQFLTPIANLHRSKGAALTVLLKKLASEKTDKKSVRSASKATSTDYIGSTCPLTITVTDEKRLVFYQAAADVESTLNLQKALLHSYPNIRLSQRLLDAHFYIFSHWILDLLCTSEDFAKLESIKGEAIPLLLQHQALQTEYQQAKSIQQEALTFSHTQQHLDNTIKCYALVTESGYCSRGCCSLILSQYGPSSHGGEPRSCRQ